VDRALSFLGRRAPLVLAFGVFLGLFLPDLARAVRPVLPITVLVLIFLPMLRIDLAGVAGHARRPLLIGAVLVWLLVVCPALAWWLSGWLGIDPGLAAALVLMAAAPPITSSPALALMLGLDASLALVVMVAATLIVPFILPTVALGLLELQLAVSAGEFILRLGALIGTAMVAAVVVRRLVGVGLLTRAAEHLDGIAVLLMLVFAVAIMDGVAAAVLADAVHVATLIGAAFVAYIALQAGSALVFSLLGRWEALTVAFAGGNRNMGLLLAVLPATVHPDVLLYFAVGQLPIYVMPSLLAPLYRWLLAKAPEE